MLQSIYQPAEVIIASLQRPYMALILTISFLVAAQSSRKAELKLTPEQNLFAK